MRAAASTHSRRESCRDHAAVLLDLTPLRHPLWWAALALLLINDNLLKGGGLLPGWLTGKLSDIAFLVVAPVLLACLLPVRVPYRRVLAFAATVGVYVVADLSPAASDAIVGWAARVGLHWRLWPDVTDLLALVVLPVSFRLAGRRGESGLRRGRRRRETAGVLVGAAACLATSSVPGYQHFPFLVNQTEAGQTVAFTGLLKLTGCDADLATLAQSLSSADLADPHSETVASGQVAALDEEPDGAEALAGRCQTATANDPYGYNSYATAQACNTLVVSVAGGPAVLVSAPRAWMEYESGSFFSCGTPPAPTSTCAPTMSTTTYAGPDALSLRVENGKLAFKAGSKLKMVAIDLAAVMARPGDAGACRNQQSRLHALLDQAGACRSDGDCQVIGANVGIPSDPICNVYVNQTLTFDQLRALRDAWSASCVTTSGLACANGPVQSPVCRAGRCAEACPGEEVPACVQLCSTYKMIPDMPCAGHELVTCYAPDGQQCQCGDAASRLSCGAPTPLSPTCPLACAAYFPIGRSDPNIVLLDGGLRYWDAGTLEAGRATDVVPLQADGGPPDTN
jgi:hypothetical protein